MGCRDPERSLPVWGSCCTCLSRRHQLGRGPAKRCSGAIPLCPCRCLADLRTWVSRGLPARGCGIVLRLDVGLQEKKGIKQMIQAACLLEQESLRLPSVRLCGCLVPLCGTC